MSSKVSRVSTRLSSAQITDLENKLVNNPYYLKFKDKIEALKQNDPETYVKRLELMLDQQENQAKAKAKVEKGI